MVYFIFTFLFRKLLEFLKIPQHEKTQKIWSNEMKNIRLKTTNQKETKNIFKLKFMLETK